MFCHFPVSPLNFTAVKLRITIEGEGPFCCVTLLAGSQSSSSVYVSVVCEASCVKTHCYMNNRTHPAAVIEGKNGCYLKKKKQKRHQFCP